MSPQLTLFSTPAAVFCLCNHFQRYRRLHHHLPPLPPHREILCRAIYDPLKYGHDHFNLINQLVIITIMSANQTNPTNESLTIMTDHHQLTYFLKLTTDQYFNEYLVNRSNADVTSVLVLIVNMLHHHLQSFLSQCIPRPACKNRFNNLVKTCPKYILNIWMRIVKIFLQFKIDTNKEFVHGYKQLNSLTLAHELLAEFQSS